MLVDPLTMSLIATGGGLLGSWLTNSGDKYSDKLIKQYEQLAKTGIGVDKLAAPGVGAVNTAFSDASRNAVANAAASGLSGTSLANVSNADLFQRRAKGFGDVYADATAENERSKERARQALMGLIGMKSNRMNAAQQAFGQLTGAGISGLLRGYQNNPEQIQLPDFGSGENLLPYKPKPMSLTEYNKSNPTYGWNW